MTLQTCRRLTLNSVTCRFIRHILSHQTKVRIRMTASKLKRLQKKLSVFYDRPISLKMSMDETHQLIDARLRTMITYQTVKLT